MGPDLDWRGYCPSAGRGTRRCRRAVRAGARPAARPGSLSRSVCIAARPLVRGCWRFGRWVTAAVAERMADHWWWRPGWRQGRRMYAWHVTFADQPAVQRLAGRYQAALAGLPG